MGNCLTHESKRFKRKSHKSHSCVVPMELIDKPLPPRLKLPEYYSVEEIKDEGVIRVKMVMKKAEAAQLLCKLSGSKDKTIELILREIGKAKSTTAVTGGHPWRPALESIPEN